MATLPIYIIEAFTVGNNRPYTGNPAAVCILQYDDEISDETKQQIACTMNLSETAFVALDWTKTGDLQNQISNPKSTETDTIRRTLRWFTPKAEVPLCGHATVASTKAILTLLNENENNEDGTQSQLFNKIEFHSKFSGILPAEVAPASKYEENRSKNTKNPKIRDDFIILNFPTNSTTKVDLGSASNPSYWLAELTRDILGRHFPFEGANVSEVIEDVQVVLRSSLFMFCLKLKVDELPVVTLSKVRPNFDKLMDAIGENELNIPAAHAVIVTIKGQGQGQAQGQIQGQPEPDFYSRFFAPMIGVDEDPVTGMAHTVLVPYWVEKLAAKNDQVLLARQSSTRGGDLWCQLQGQKAEGENENTMRVNIGGRARIAVKGSINV